MLQSDSEAMPKFLENILGTVHTTFFGGEGAEVNLLQSEMSNEQAVPNSRTLLFSITWGYRAVLGISVKTN